MKSEKLVALKHLLQKSTYEEVQHKFFNREKSLEYHWFKMERENFLFVFGRRLKTSKMMDVTIKGLEETIQEFSKSDCLIILSHTLETEVDTVLVYTNENITKIFGVVEPNK